MIFDNLRPITRIHAIFLAIDKKPEVARNESIDHTVR